MAERQQEAGPGASGRGDEHYLMRAQCSRTHAPQSKEPGATHRPASRAIPLATSFAAYTAFATRASGDNFTKDVGVAAQANMTPEHIALAATILAAMAAWTVVFALRKRTAVLARTREEEEAIASVFLDAHSDMILLCRLDGKIVRANRAAVRTLERSLSELVGLNIGSLDAESDQSAETNRYRWNKDSGASDEIRTRFCRKDGCQLSVQIQGAPLNCGAETFMLWRARTTDDPLADKPRPEESTYRVLFEKSADASLIIDHGRFVACNDATVKMLRYASREQVCQTHPSELSPPTQPDGRDSYEKADEMMAIAMERGSHRFEWNHKRADGEVFPVEVLLTSIPFEGRRILNVVWRDITERKEAASEKEQLLIQLHQSQKMDAIGQLAGGIAHDFNNILTAILGNIELLQASVDRDDEPREFIEEGLEQIGQSAERAATLTRQLLAFSRQQASQLEILDLRRTIDALGQMLHRLLTEDIRLKFHAPPDIRCVRADPSQVEQVVINLVVNARDAMPDGGAVTISLEDVYIDSAYVQSQPQARIGPHVLLSVRDQGTGMSEETLKRLFEPFYTTKEIGRGTGLGLATVYGIVKQAGGHITVGSNHDKGSVFKVYWPAAPASARPTDMTAPRAAADEQGSETILLCEDDTPVRELTAQFLRDAGYAVAAAAGGKEALEMAAAHREPIDILITDVIMPDMNGKQVAENLTSKMPNLRVLFVSGYTDNVIAHHGVLDPGVDFVSKPYSRKFLLRRVREILDRNAEAAPNTTDDQAEAGPTPCKAPHNHNAALQKPET